MELPKTRKGAIAFYSKVLKKAAEKSPEHLIAWQRFLARNDLFFLLVYVLRRKDINRDWLFDRCREVQASPNGHLDLWAREHYKSTIITWALSIQDIIASHGENPEPRYGGREVTIGIFSHTRPIAKGFLIQIKNEFEENERLKSLFPDIFYDRPKSQAPKWSEDGGLVVKRKGNPKEATVEAWGLVDGQPTSKHFFVRVYDDVVTLESVSTPDQIKKTTAAWEMSDNLGTEGGWERYIGTKYYIFDTYATMVKRGAVKVRKHPATSDGTDDCSKSVLMSPETLAAKRKTQGLYTFACQMLQDPKADTSMGFREEWLRYWKAEHTNNLNVYILVDPASSKKKNNDFTAMWVIGVGSDGKYRVLDAVRDKLNLKERSDTLFQLVRDWNPIRVGYEQYGLQADIEFIRLEMERKNFEFEIVELGGKLAKEDRIKRLVPFFERGDIVLLDRCVKVNYEGHAVDLTREFVEEEYNAFPVCAHDDMLDALARMLDEDMHVELPSPNKSPVISQRPIQRHGDWMTS